MGIAPEAASPLFTAPQKYWWVNHSRTYKQEIGDGYIWAPLTTQDGHEVRAYENLNFCRPGDVIFSYSEKAIRNVGVVVGRPELARKPLDFGRAGDAWKDDGRLVPIRWARLATPVEPVKHSKDVLPLLPERNSPLKKSNLLGNQSYLHEISVELGTYLLKLIESNYDPTIFLGLEDLKQDEQTVVDFIYDMDEIEKQYSVLSVTETKALRSARIGQGVFKDRVLEIEPACRLTGVRHRNLLNASHIKPWRESTNEERLSPFNGLALSPHIDRLFDRYLITFDPGGGLLVKNELAREALQLWGATKPVIAKPFRKEQEEFLSLHRERLRS